MNELQEHTNAPATPKIVGAIVISAVIVIAAYFLIFRKDDDLRSTASTVSSVTSSVSTEASDTAAKNNTTTSTASNTTASANDQPAATSTAYVDGTYTASVNYAVPEGGANTLKVTLVLANDTVSSVTTVSTYSERESSEYVNGFKSRISSAVSGKPIESAFVGRIGGASLTSEAFNQALNAILNDAKS